LRLLHAHACNRGVIGVQEISGRAVPKAACIVQCCVTTCLYKNGYLPDCEMKLIRNTGRERVVDELRPALAPPASLDIASPVFSLFAFAELRELLEKLDRCRIVLGLDGHDVGLQGTEKDRAFRNRLNLYWLARECSGWLQKKAELRSAPGTLPQEVLMAGDARSATNKVITGNCPFSTELGPQRSGHVTRSQTLRRAVQFVYC
jgi:hypothetical protein